MRRAAHLDADRKQPFRLDRLARVVLLAALGLLALLALPSAAPAQQGLVTGLTGPDQYQNGNPATRALWFDRTVGAGAGIVRLPPEWGEVAPQRPDEPTNPASYNLDSLNGGAHSLDGAVRDARARGVQVLITVNHAPDWAEGPGRPANAQPGTWKPNPSDLADFVRALAARYSGGFDPDGSGPAPPLPAAQALEVWNEPNQEFFLSPAYEGYAKTVLGTSGLLSYWRLGESSGSTAVDSSGSNDGTYQGGSTLGEPGALTGNSSTSVKLDGASGYVHVPDAASLDVTGPLTLEAWVKFRPGGTARTSQAVVAKGDGAYRLHRYLNSNRIAFGTSGLSNVDLPSNSTSVFDGNWHHLVGTWDGSTKSLYVDGQLDAQVAATGALSSNSHALGIGENSQATGRFWDGWIDEPAVYNQALSATTIQRHYNVGQGTTAFSPDHYHDMLNASYNAVKAVNPQMLVVTGGNSPYGDPPGGPHPDPNNRRIRPVQFWQQALCVHPVANPQVTYVRTEGCAGPALFDVFAHHPIDNTGGGPLQSGPSPDDVSTPDLGRLVSVLRGAEQAGTTLPGSHPVWVTEFWWDSNPPNPVGAPLDVQARWIEQSLYLFWKAGASAAINFQIRDATFYPDTRNGYQSGLYFLNGSPKPALTAFRFPFVTERITTKTLRAWGKAPEGGTLRIQQKQGSRWVTIKQLQVTKGAVFLNELSSGKTAFRATVGASQSLVWQQS
jgi:hypothetical protein